MNGIQPGAEVALVFNQQAINILAIDHEFPHRQEVQAAAAEHLLRVFSVPPPQPQGATG